MSTKPSVEMYLCAFHLENGRLTRAWRTRITEHSTLRPLSFTGCGGDDCGARQEKHADAVHRMYEAVGVNLKTATEAEKASLRTRLMDEARKGGMSFRP
jgi:hypothetical protein